MVTHRKRIVIALVSLGIFLLIWWVFSPGFDPSQASIINQDADYPILTPKVLPRERNEKFYLLVIISSSPKGVSYERRKTIRETWGSMDSKSERKVLTLFMTGMTGDSKTDEKLLGESRSFGDLIICDYIDTYSTILNKLLASFKWAESVADKYQYQYLLKTDDDVFVNIPRLFSWIDDVGSKRPFVYAGFLYTGPVIRIKGHRHYVSKEALPYDFFPWFCKGATMLLSGNLVPKTVELSRKVHRIIPDDAYVGLIMNELKVKPMWMIGLIQNQHFPKILNVVGFCIFKNAIGVSDSLTTEQIRGLYQVTRSSEGSVIWCFLSWWNLLWIILFLFIYYKCINRNIDLKER